MINGIGVHGHGRTKELQEKINKNYKFDPNDILEDIKPQSKDIIIKKLKPSGFYGTNLQSFLNLFGADTLLILGTTTSGCVRATAIDGFSANYKICIIEDCCFDRSESSHAINLCDLNAKYADVIESNEVIKYLNDLEDNLFKLPLGDDQIIISLVYWFFYVN